MIVMTDRYYVNDVRMAWPEIAAELADATEPVTIYTRRRGRPTVPEETPYLAVLPPALYDAYRDALGEPERPAVELKRATGQSIDVDWTDADDANAVIMDGRAFRGGWAVAHRRIANDDLHVIRIDRYPAPGHRVAVLTPLQFAERGKAALAKTGADT